MVQEALTNALRYAAGAPGRGYGLRGLRERVGACGGTLEAGPRPDGGWRVVARMPRRALAHALDR